MKQDEKITHCIEMNEDTINSGHASQKQITPEVCSVYNLRNRSNIQKSVNNICAVKEKRDPVSNINLKNNFADKQKLTSVSTFNKFSTTKKNWK